MENLVEIRGEIQTDLKRFYEKVFQTDLDSIQTVKKYGLAVLQDIIDDNEDSEEKLKVARSLLSRIVEVPNFIGDTNAEIGYEKSFDYLVNSVTDAVHMNVRGGTVREFYSLYEYLMIKWSSKKQ